MTARDTYASSVKSAETSKVASLTVNETTKQTTIDASKSVVGYTLQTGNYANLASAVATANAAKVTADRLAEHNKQVARDTARDILRNSGDFAVV